MLLENSQREHVIVVAASHDASKTFAQDVAALIGHPLHFVPTPHGRLAARVVSGGGSLVRMFKDVSGFEVRVLGDPALAYRLEALVDAYDAPIELAA